ASGRLFPALAANDIHNWNDNWAALGLFKQEVRNMFFEFLLEAVQVDPFEALSDGPSKFGAKVIHQLFVVTHINEAAADNVRAGQQVARLLVDSQNHGY